MNIVTRATIRILACFLHFNCSWISKWRSLSTQKYTQNAMRSRSAKFYFQVHTTASPPLKREHLPLREHLGCHQPAEITLAVSAGAVCCTFEKERLDSYFPSDLYRADLHVTIPSTRRYLKLSQVWIFSGIKRVSRCACACAAEN
jgi:hypothetical protein